jgi:polyisoprenyl-phosphate glycosyltransferase
MPWAQPSLPGKLTPGAPFPTAGTMTTPTSCIVVTPVYEDLGAASQLFANLRAELGADLFVVVVDDGSVHGPVPAGALHGAGLDGVTLRLKRNVGHQRAIAVGLAYVAEYCSDLPCVVMDSDGEDLPETIPHLLARLAEDGVDVVVAQRRKRIETAHFKVFYLIYKLIFELLTGRQISFGNFMAMAPQAVQRLAVMPELGIHVAGAVLVSRLRLVLCPLDRGRRYSGKTKMNFTSLVLHGCRALMIFAEDVLLRICLLCFAVATVSVLGIIVTIVLKTIGLATPGWFSVALGILLLVLLQTSALALMTLMMTGLVRSGSPIALDYKPLIDRVLRADACAPA